MSHFAEINSDNIVTNVIVAEQEFIDSGILDTHKDGNDNLLHTGTWVQTSYNTKGGIHYATDFNAPDGRTPDGGVALRKNYARIGHIYDATRDAFYEPQPYPSWTLDDDTCLWNAPVAYPDDGKMYDWDEDTTSWVEVE
jgi:hypothetical protein